MSTWFQPIPFEGCDAFAWLNLVPPNSFRVFAPDAVPGPFSPNLIQKCAAILIMRSGSEGEDYVVGNLYRRDKGAIDQMPFGSLFVSGSSSAGILAHHGDWDARTFSGSNKPPSYCEISEIGSKGYEAGFATLGLPQQESGSIFDINPKSNIDAFSRIVGEIRDGRSR